jgi:hypothetical protein
MSFLSIVGLITLIAVGLVFVAGVVLFVIACARLRGGDLRRYEVFDTRAADLAPSMGHRFTFFGARRLACRHRGTRIFDARDTSFVVARPGWSETQNGYYGRYLSSAEAAKLLDVAPDEDQGSGRWETLHRLLTDRGVRSSVDTGDGSLGYNANDVIALSTVYGRLIRPARRRLS